VIKWLALGAIAPRVPGKLVWNAMSAVSQTANMETVHAEGVGTEVVSRTDRA
jgi:hypothetical protein